jgi:hypothetical protein
MFWRKLGQSRIDLLPNFSAVIMGSRTRKRRRDIMVELDILTTTLLAK